jgi:CheY-specific phosphatase CheX
MSNVTHSNASLGELLATELPRVMNEVLLALLGVPAVNAVLVNVPAKHHSSLACRVRIRGDFEGEVIVSATPELADSVAARMFEEDLKGAPTPREAREALREVANIVAGNLKPLLGPNNQLGLPEDLADTGPPARVDPVARATLEHRAGTLYVVVYTSL